jgi:hypothetical protein
LENDGEQTNLVDCGLVLKDVEFDSLGKRSALTNCHDITFRDCRKGRRAVDRHLGVAFFESKEEKD